jgi:hypothetical protein
MGKDDPLAVKIAAAIATALAATKAATKAKEDRDAAAAAAAADTQKEDAVGARWAEERAKAAARASDPIYDEGIDPGKGWVWDGEFDHKWVKQRGDGEDVTTTAVTTAVTTAATATDAVAATATTGTGTVFNSNFVGKKPAAPQTDLLTNLLKQSS